MKVENRAQRILIVLSVLICMFWIIEFMINVGIINIWSLISFIIINIVSISAIWLIYFGILKIIKGKH